MGLEALPGRDAVGGVAVPEAGLWAIGKCARILTVPTTNRLQVGMIVYNNCYWSSDKLKKCPTDN